MHGFRFGMQGGYLRTIKSPRKVRLGFDRSFNVLATIADGYIVYAEQRNPSDLRSKLRTWKATR